MPKLKLTGRKLCTSGRKLAVCGCTPAFACCQNNGNCRFAVPNSPFNFKAWGNWSYSGTYYAGTIGAAYSGSCDLAYTFANTSQNHSDVAGPCSWGASANTALSGSGPACSGPPSSVSTDNRFNTLVFLPQFPTFSGGPTWATSPSGWTFGGGSNGTQTATVIIRMLFVVNVRDASGRSGAPSVHIEVGMNNGVPFAVNPTLNWTGTITPTVIRDGQCFIGMRVDYNLSRTFRSGNLPSDPFITETSAGYGVVVLCNKLIGCAGTGFDCSSATPPGAPSLLGSLDDALFS